MSEKTYKPKSNKPKSNNIKRVTQSNLKPHEINKTNGYIMYPKKTRRKTSRKTSRKPKFIINFLNRFKKI